MDGYLQYLIQEEIYLVKEDEGSSGQKKEIFSHNADHPVKKLKNISILVLNSGGAGELPGRVRELLTNILCAINLKLEEIILIDLDKSETKDDILDDYELKHCKIIGFLDSIPTSYLKIFPARKYEIQDSKTFKSLLVDPLEKIDLNRSKKKILWDKLQELYQLG